MTKQSIDDCPSNKATARKDDGIPVAPDGGWGWVVIAATFFVNGIVLGIHNSYGVFMDYFVEKKVLGITSDDTASTAAIGSISFGTMFLFGPVSGILCDKIGIRVTTIVGATTGMASLFLVSLATKTWQLYIIYGAIWGISSSMCYTTSFVALGQYFKRHLSLANGIATAGSGIGGLVLTPAITNLLVTVGWQNTFRVLSAVTCLLIVCGLLLTPLQQEDAISKLINRCRKASRKSRKESELSLGAYEHPTVLYPEGQKLGISKTVTFTDLQIYDTVNSPNDTLSQATSTVASHDNFIEEKAKKYTILSKLHNYLSFIQYSHWKSNAYIMWVLSVSVVEFGYIIPYMYLVQYARSVGIGRTNSSMLLAYLGIVATASKLFFSKIFDHPRVNRVYFCQFSTLILCICVTCLPLARNYGDFLAITLVFGWFDGCYTALIGVVTMDIVGSKTYAQALGQLYVLMAVSQILGPIIIGEAYTATTSFEIPFFVTGAVLFAGSALASPVARYAANCKHYTVSNAIKHRMRRSMSLAGMEGSGVDIRGLRRSSSFVNRFQTLIASKSQSNFDTKAEYGYQKTDCEQEIIRETTV